MASRAVLKWIKQHLNVKSFLRISENAVRIQIYVAIITYCLIGIIEHDLKLGRCIMQVMRILGSSLLTKDDIMDLLIPFEEATKLIMDSLRLILNSININ